MKLMDYVMQEINSGFLFHIFLFSMSKETMLVHYMFKRVTRTLKFIVFRMSKKTSIFFCQFFSASLIELPKTLSVF